MDQRCMRLCRNVYRINAENLMQKYSCAIKTPRFSCLVFDLAAPSTVGKCSSSYVTWLPLMIFSSTTSPSLLHCLLTSSMHSSSWPWTSPWPLSGQEWLSRHWLGPPNSTDLSPLDHHCDLELHLDLCHHSQHAGSCSARLQKSRTCHQSLEWFDQWQRGGSRCGNGSKYIHDKQDHTSSSCRWI